MSRVIYESITSISKSISLIINCWLAIITF